MWVKHVYETTHVWYKPVLKYWFKGTSGGPGLTTMLETWDDKQLEKYGIGLENYDHTNISTHPAILFDMYC